MSNQDRPKPLHTALSMGFPSTSRLLNSQRLEARLRSAAKQKAASSPGNSSKPPKKMQNSICKRN